MNPFTERKGISPLSNLLSAEEATIRITSKLTTLEQTRELNKELLQFWVEKLVLDVLDYCHRADFPDALIYTCVDLIRKRLADMDEAAGGAPLKKLVENDVTFEWAVDNAESTVLAGEILFASIKPKLNLYRKVISR